ncbi:hypothetical protein QYM36_009112 [Artemia franciscana]|uniref:Uncharacterized protein n=1 Tax=Artemia franciscana TaxID=6661 RepID=A0AA88HS71_ARTSF|nr:hypothetical protein QYM36_009112 [Artemia franciscana]
MEELGVIEKVLQPTDWVNVMVVIEKPGKSLPVCINPHDLNRAIKRPHHLIPTFDEAILRLAEAEFFKKLDACHGYWSLVLNEESSQLATFNTSYGRYKFKRMCLKASKASLLLLTTLSSKEKPLRNMTRMFAVLS